MQYRFFSYSEWNSQDIILPCIYGPIQNLVVNKRVNDQHKSIFPLFLVLKIRSFIDQHNSIFLQFIALNKQVVDQHKITGFFICQNYTIDS